MAVGVIDRQPLGYGGGVKGLIGRDQRHRAQPGLLALLTDFERGGQLHGVIGAQRVRIRQPHGIVGQDGRDLDDGVATGEMLAEAMKDRRCLRGGERSAFSAAGDGGGDFDSSNAGDVNTSGWMGCGA
ncbi:MAG: hypothetical protein ACHRXM_16915 [Isosphaerales bacterium]